MTDTTRDLVNAAKAAAAHAYAPYSGFGVGAAVRLEDGRIVTGCNFENASLGLALCAETVALATTNAQGDLRSVREIAIIGGTISNGQITGADPVRPCGRCRQILHEASSVCGYDIDVICASADGGTIERHTLSSLLPHAFGPADLGIS